MQESSEMEDDIDIYSDLSVNNEKSIEKCQKCSELESLIVKLEQNVNDLQKVNKNLELNISSLLLTAKSEISRKDRMIADLRRQLDDASFRRGKFKRGENYNSKCSNFELNTFEGGSEVCIKNEWPQQSGGFQNNFQPSLPKSVTAEAQPPLPKDFNAYIPPPPPPEVNQVDSVKPSLLKTIYTSEYTCNSEHFPEEEDTDQKYEPQKIVNTIFSQRLRKKLEEEEIQRKILEKEEAEKKLAQERERKEGEEKERLQLSEETLRNLKSLPERESEDSPKRNLDNKENVSCPNQLNKNSELLISQSTVLNLEEDSTKNRPVLANKVSIKRSLNDYDEEIDIKRQKIDHYKSYDDYREDWSHPGPEIVKVKQEPESIYSNIKNDSLEKVNGFKDDKHDKICGQDDSRHDLVSKLFQISAESVPSNQKGRRDLDRRKEYSKRRSRDRDKYDKDRYERDKYERDKYERNKHEKDKYEKERYEKDRYEKEKYREKFHKEKFERDKYKDRVENERYERDKYDSYRFEKEKDKPKYIRERDKFEKNMNERKYNERDRFERSKLKPNKFGRTQSLSPERMDHSSNRSLKNNEFKDNFEKRNQRTSRYEHEDLRKKLVNYKSNREIEETPSLLRRNIHNDGDKKNNELLKNSNNSRSRSSSSGKSYKIDSDKKISLDSYRARKEQKLPKSNSSERSRSSSKDNDKKIGEDRLLLEDQKSKLEKELAQLDCVQSYNTKVCENEDKYHNDDRQNVEKDIVQINSEISKLSDISEKSICEDDLEEGEISDSSSTPSLRIYENEEKKEIFVLKASGNLDMVEKKIEDLEKNIMNKIDKVEDIKMKDQIRNENTEENKLLIQGKEFTSSSVPDEEVKKIGNTQEPCKHKIIPVINESVKKIENIKPKILKKNNENIDVVLEKKLQEIPKVYNENLIINQVSNDSISKKLVLKVLEPNSVENMDLFIESGNNGLEENSEEHRGEKISKKVEQDSKEGDMQEVKKQTAQNEKILETKEIEVSSKSLKLKLKNDVSPVKERKKVLRNLSNERKGEKDIVIPVQEEKEISGTVKEKKEVSNSIHEKKEILNLMQVKKVNSSTVKEKEIRENEMLSPTKEKKKNEQIVSKIGGKEKEVSNPMKNNKQTEFREGEKEKEVLSPGNDNKKHKRSESKEKDVSSPVKENKQNKQNDSKDGEEKEVSSSIEEKVKVNEKENLEEIVKPLEEVNPKELKKDNSSKMLTSVKDSKQGMQPVVVLDYPSKNFTTGRIRRKPIKFLDDDEVPPKPKDEIKPKEPKKQIQKVSETKAKTEKPTKRVVVTIKRRKRPVVLSDCNASSTIVANKNVIMNIKLNKSDEKNLLS